MTSVAQALLDAQRRAAALFEACVAEGVLRPGAHESEISQAVHALARERFGVRRHWHRRVVRAGPNTLLTYRENGPDRRLASDDVVFLDFGPVFDDWEADYGRTYVLGADPDKHRLVRDLDEAIKAGKAFFAATPAVTAGDMYEFVRARAEAAGWAFGAPTAGHLVGHFPHETAPDKPARFTIRSGNAQPIREPDEHGESRHWILEAHFIDRRRAFGGFVEELLTL